MKNRTLIAGLMVALTAGACGGERPREPALIDSYTLSPDGITLTLYTEGGCGDLDHKKVTESNDSVTIDLASTLQDGTMCGGVGRLQTATVRLKSPLGQRRVLDANFKPNVVPSGGTDLAGTLAIQFLIEHRTRTSRPAALQSCGWATVTSPGEPEETAMSETDAGRVRTWKTSSGRGTAGHTTTDRWSRAGCGYEQTAPAGAHGQTPAVRVPKTSSVLVTGGLRSRVVVDRD
jgi:hypothetical protein